jgi:hypothetical protein
MSNEHKDLVRVRRGEGETTKGFILLRHSRHSGLDDIYLAGADMYPVIYPTMEEAENHVGRIGGIFESIIIEVDIPSHWLSKEEEE